MFVVIQEIQLKKPNTHGAYKEFEVQSTSFIFDNETKTSYSYYPNYDSGSFERLHREAYKISVHQSYREGGKVKKKQCVIATIGYYGFADGWPLYDLTESGLAHAAEMFGKDSDALYDIVEAKIKPLRDRIQKEYHKTEEYKVTQERDKVQKKYQKAKAAFAKKYSVDSSEYDFCYNIFGEVMNQPYLDRIIQKAKSYSSYYENCGSTYNQNSTYGSGQAYSSYFPSSCSTYTDDEKADLKKFYKVLAQKFHPDMNPDTDTTKAMQLLNKLKEEWNI